MNSVNNSADRDRHKGRVWQDLRMKIQSEKYVVGIMPNDIGAQDQRFNAGIDEEVLDIARKSGIKISDTALEELRRECHNFMYDNSIDELEERYNRLFDTISPLINEYRAGVTVGFTEENKAVVLIPIGDCYIDLIHEGEDNDKSPADLREEIERSHIYPAKVIVQNLILAISWLSREYKQNIDTGPVPELELARRFIESIAYDNVSQDIMFSVQTMLRKCKHLLGVASYYML